jgi:hypothetical protein
MSDPNHPQDQPEPSPTPRGRWVFIEEDQFGQERKQLDEALGRPRPDAASGKDKPTPASELKTPGEIKGRREENIVRREDEDLKDRKLRRWGFGLVLMILAVVAAASAAFLVVAGLHKEFALAAPALALLGGSGALSVQVWKIFSSTVMPVEQVTPEDEQVTDEASLPPDPAPEAA